MSSLTTCEAHSGAVVVFTGDRWTSCPVCTEIEGLKKELDSKADELEEKIGAMELAESQLKEKTEDLERAEIQLAELRKGTET